MWPGIDNLSANPDIGELLSLPTGVYPLFWGWILFGVWVIIVLTTYFAEKETRGFGRMIESLAVASIPVMILATLGSIVGFISLEVMIYTLTIGFVFIG